MPRHAEIAGAGFGGLIAAIALAERGWSVRVHERTPLLRAEGFSISIQKNMAKVLEAIGVLETVRAGGARIDLREVRDVRDRVIMATPTGGRAWRVSRLHIIRTLAERAQELGVEIEFESAATDVEPDGTLTVSDGRQRCADLVVCADGINSVLRDRLGLLRRRTSFRDGAMRVMIPMRESDAEGRLTERWSGARRTLIAPAGSGELYVALACAAADDEARAAPIDVETWERSFPHLGDLFHRIREHAEWDRVGWIRFQTIRLERWSTGRTAVLGDAAHAMSPNLGQGAGCAMMNALGLAVALGEISDVPAALTAWEQRERPLTEHTQRWARIYGAATFWPDGLRSAAFRLTARSGWLNRRYQRTAEHDPTGYSPAPV